jgi:hypothetical protein
MRIAVVGLGAVGRRVCDHLAQAGVEVVGVTHASWRTPASPPAGLTDLVDRISKLGHADAAVLCLPAGGHTGLVDKLMGRCQVLVSTSDEAEESRGLLARDSQARAANTRLVVGASFSPGLTCALARVAANHLEEFDEIHVARYGTGGPSCARQHHRALRSRAEDFRDGEWLQRPGGSGRELVWFPDDVGASDCYRAALADPYLLVDAFGPLTRVTARLAATRRDRLTSPFPMLRQPHPEGLRGAVRVEVRGMQAGTRQSIVYGATQAPAAGAAAVAASVALHASSWMSPGAHGCANFGADLVRQVMMLGCRVTRFEGGRSLGW